MSQIQNGKIGIDQKEQDDQQKKRISFLPPLKPIWLVGMVIMVVMLSVFATYFFVQGMKLPWTQKDLKVNEPYIIDDRVILVLKGIKKTEQGNFLRFIAQFTDQGKTEASQALNLKEVIPSFHLQLVDSSGKMYADSESGNLHMAGTDVINGTVTWEWQLPIISDEKQFILIVKTIKAADLDQKKKKAISTPSEEFVLRNLKN
ncbi:hypothetical protein [Thermoflavimicrobium dichotomicum]|uniref:Uncharacterized protein n=1 Tax=Thermoflavimicrobium dichotomicum TaxID=46223 RepID=A0A1I3JI62_9BACL|nr:hypothetical protein [Thermoflavimicrobium dichotomicum]SFI59939.1 hypothetical protein SAMN05421852_10186 [Thermoflavimicrobium dichotomicum]